MNESLVLLEKKNLPEHLLSIENLETPVTLQSMIADLQDAGEVSWLYLLLEFENTNQNCGGTTSKLWRKHQSKLWLFPEAKLEVSHHKLQDDKCTNVKPIVFIMDDPPQPKVKKQKKTKDSVSITTKNFGSWINVSKIKTCSDTFKIGWRCRFLDNCFVFGLERISVSLDFMNIYWGLIHTSSNLQTLPSFSLLQVGLQQYRGTESHHSPSSYPMFGNTNWCEGGNIASYVNHMVHCETLLWKPLPSFWGMWKFEKTNIEVSLSIWD